MAAVTAIYAVVVTAGVPVQVTGIEHMSSARISATITNGSNRIYVGVSSTMNKATHSGVIAELLPESLPLTFLDAHSLPSQIWIDSDIAGAAIIGYAIDV